MPPALVILAAGLGTRFGALKQLAPVGRSGEALLDYAVYDAVRAGCQEVFLVIRVELEEAFQRHARRLEAGGLTVTLVAQRKDDLPSGVAPPADREKPWGTGHAVLAVREHIAGPFIVCNADDFYGAHAFERVAEHLRNAGRHGEHAIVGYRLDVTLSPFGGVSRAVCDLAPDGFLRGITEVKDIREREGGLAGVTVAGVPFPVAPDALVSTGLWGFTAAVFAPLRAQFERFLASFPLEREAEFLLSAAIDEQIALGQARVRALSAARSEWMGVTFVEDVPRVERALEKLVERGVYPRDVGAVLSRWEQRRGRPSPFGR